MHPLKAGTRVAFGTRFKTGDGTVFEKGSEGTVEYRYDGGHLTKVRMDMDLRHLFVPLDFPLVDISNQKKETQFREGAD